MEVLVRAMDEPVAPGGQLRDVELLAVEERGIAVGVPDRRAFLDERRLRLELLAVAEEARRAGVTPIACPQWSAMQKPLL